VQLLLVHTITCLVDILSRGVDLAAAFEDGSEEDSLFLKRLALLLCEKRVVAVVVVVVVVVVIA
jgi:hypothetical protein